MACESLRGPDYCRLMELVKHQERVLGGDASASERVNYESD